MAASFVCDCGVVIQDIESSHGCSLYYTDSEYYTAGIIGINIVHVVVFLNSCYSGMYTTFIISMAPSYTCMQVVNNFIEDWNSSRLKQPS